MHNKVAQESQDDTTLKNMSKLYISSMHITVLTKDWPKDIKNLY